MNKETLDEVAKCFRSPAYFIGAYGRIYDATLREWIPFDLWPAQETTLQTISDEQLIIILKARQLGLTWLVLGFALWLMLFRPAAAVLLFSRRDTESIHLLDERLKGMYARLPDWITAGIRITADSKHAWQLSNGSVAYAFPTTAGDSYTATLAIVDEADLVPDLDDLMTAVKPTIDGGGKMILLSRADKSRPESPFKKMYRAAKQRLSDWVAVFLPWHVRPSRDSAWYERQRRDIQARTGALDDLHEQYPATDVEALAPATLDKRIPPAWLLQCYEALEPLGDEELTALGAPALPNLRVYRPPKRGRRYVLGVDPAEGNPSSDASAVSVVDVETGEEAAVCAGRFQPDATAAYADELGHWYNRAQLMVERNNHGHAVLLWLKDNSKLKVLKGHDKRPGWLSNSKGKALMYATGANAFRDGDALIHDFTTYSQLSSIEGSTLRAPDDGPDDQADAYVLGQAGAQKRVVESRIY
jgi:hypothetical protein